MILVLILGIGVGIFFGVVSQSAIIGIIAGIVGLCSLAAAWNEAGATINQATQHKRDKAILDELKKMNGEE